LAIVKRGIWACASAYIWARALVANSCAILQLQFYNYNIIIKKIIQYILTSTILLVNFADSAIL
jgi:hypothetical protein